MLMQMKRIIIDLEEGSKESSEIIQTAFNYNFNDFLIGEKNYTKLENIERATLFSRVPSIEPDYLIFDNVEKFKKESFNLPLTTKVGIYCELESKEDERKIKELSDIKTIDFFIISAGNWKVIPFENLIAYLQSKNIELIAKVDNIEEAELLLNTLEIGVDGVLIEVKSPNELANIKKILFKTVKIELSTAKITQIQNISESDRVCVDTTSLLYPGEGMLVGSTARGFVLVHAEVFETQFVSSRPFRVNAGDVSAYVLVPPKEEDPEIRYKTRYLSELKGGEEIYVVNTKGIARIVTIGRVKIETRPMKRFQLISNVNNEEIRFSCILQNAETIRLIDKDEKVISVPELKKGDEILIHLGPKATHFGTKIEEKIIEK